MCCKKGVNKNCFRTLLYWQFGVETTLNSYNSRTECVWVNVHTACTKHEASIEAKPFSGNITWIRTFSNFLPAFQYLTRNLTVIQAARLVNILEAWGSNLGGKQTDHHVSKEYVYWGPSGQSPSTQFQLRRDRVVKQAAESVPQLESFGMWRRVHSWVDSCEIRWNMVSTRSGLNVMRRAEMISSDIWKKEEDWSWERTDSEWW